MEVSQKIKEFGEILLSEQLIDYENLVWAISITGNSIEKLGELLIKKGLIKEEELLKAYSKLFGIPYISHIKLQGIENILKKISKSFLKKHKIFPYKKEGEKVFIATSSPTNYQAMEEIAFIVGEEIETELVLAPQREILKAIDREYDRAIYGEEKSIDFGINFAPFIKEQEEEELLDEGDAPAIRFVRNILEDAVSSRASDIHIEPTEKETIVRFRIDGILHEIIRQNKELHNSIVSRIKVMANLNIAETRIPQDGRIKRKIAGDDIDIRVSTIPTYFGEKVVLRLLNKSSINFSLENIGLSDELLSKYKRLLKHTEGMIVITGPTGSGKSTTLYASLLHLNTPTKNIMTIEDPVEYQIEGINHIQVNPSIGFDFATGLRAILRQDPDIIMVGEIRDKETARVSIQSALTGHLVLTTLHTNDSISAITRLIDIGIEPYLVSPALKGIVAQRLVRKVCKYCEEKYTPSKEEINIIRENLHIKENIVLKRGKGCKRCKNTGYYGRTAIYEILVINEEIQKAIVQGKDEGYIKKIAIKNGLKTLKQNGIEKALRGITTIDEVLRVTFT